MPSYLVGQSAWVAGERSGGRGRGLQCCAIEERFPNRPDMTAVLAPKPRDVGHVGDR